MQATGVKICFKSDSEKSFHKYFMSSKITMNSQVVLSTSTTAQKWHQGQPHPERGVWDEGSPCKELIPCILWPRQSQIPSCPGAARVSWSTSTQVQGRSQVILEMKHEILPIFHTFNLFCRKYSKRSHSKHQRRCTGQEHRLCSQIWGSDTYYQCDLGLVVASLHLTLFFSWTVVTKHTNL